MNKKYQPAKIVRQGNFRPATVVRRPSIYQPATIVRQGDFQPATIVRNSGFRPATIWRQSDSGMADPNPDNPIQQALNKIGRVKANTLSFREAQILLAHLPWRANRESTDIKYIQPEPLDAHELAFLLDKPADSGSMIDPTRAQLNHNMMSQLSELDVTSPAPVRVAQQTIWDMPSTKYARPISVDDIDDSSYPDDYRGFVKESFVLIEAKEATGRCDLWFGPGDTGLALLSENIFRDGNKIIFRFKGEDDENDRPRSWYLENMWPSRLATDIFDRVRISIADWHSLRLRSIKIRYNGVDILDYRFDSSVAYRNRITLDSMICRARLAMLGESILNPVLTVAALELGKSWDPKYGKRWDLKTGEGQGNWCSEFVRWVLLQSRGWTMENGELGTKDMVNFFCRNMEMSNLYLDKFASKQAMTRFITPQIDNYWHKDESFFYSKVFFRNLLNTLHPGYYVKVRRGNHSAFFINWRDRFFRHKDNYFLSIGGSQGRRVSIERNTYVTHNAEDEEASICWNAQSHLLFTRKNEDIDASMDLRYPDGFGNTEAIPPYTLGRTRPDLGILL